MANFCENIVDFYHNDINEVQKMKKLVEDTGVLLSNYMPEPKQYAEGSKDFWKWRADNWGTTSDPTDIEVCYSDANPNEITLIFHTAWNSPIEFFNNMVDLGWRVECVYEEEALQLVGRYTNKKDEYIEDLFDNFISGSLPIWAVEGWGHEILERLHILGRIDDEGNLIDTEENRIEKSFGEWGHCDVVESYKKEIA